MIIIYNNNNSNINNNNHDRIAGRLWRRSLPCGQLQLRPRSLAPIFGCRVTRDARIRIGLLIKRGGAQSKSRDFVGRISLGRISPEGCTRPHAGFCYISISLVPGPGMINYFLLILPAIWLQIWTEND